MSILPTEITSQELAILALAAARRGVTPQALLSEKIDEIRREREQPMFQLRTANVLPFRKQAVEVPAA